MKRKGFPAVLSVALVLLCLVLVTAHFTTGMYARFTTKSGDNDTGRIARFKVSATSSQTDPVEISAAHDKGTYTVTLANPGDVAVRYVAKVVFDRTADADKFKPIEPITGEIAPRGSVDKSITFDMSGYTGGGADTVPFTVVVTFTQID